LKRKIEQRVKKSGKNNRCERVSKTIENIHAKQVARSDNEQDNKDWIPRDGKRNKPPRPAK
jgi:predicted secreted Zn-dependent protease